MVYPHVIQVWRSARALGQRGVQVVQQQASEVRVARAQRRHRAQRAAAQALFQRQPRLRQFCKYCGTLIKVSVNVCKRMCICAFGSKHRVETRTQRERLRIGPRVYLPTLGECDSGLE